MKHKVIMFFTAALMIFSFGCRESENKEEFKVNVKNLTETEISEISAAPETDKSNFTDYLAENLPVGGEVEISFGELFSDDIAKGFAVNVTGADDNSVGEFSMLMLKNGSTLTFYMDDYGLAVAVDMTDEEVEELKQRDHEDFIAATTAAETTDSAES